MNMSGAGHGAWPLTFLFRIDLLLIMKVLIQVRTGSHFYPQEYGGL